MTKPTPAPIRVFHHGKLRVRLTRKGRTVTAKVLEQDEGLRGKSLLAVEGRYEIRAVLMPAIWENTGTLWLRGSELREDESEVSDTFPTASAAQQYVAAMKRLIAAVNEPAKATPKPALTTEQKAAAWDRIVAAFAEIVGGEE